MVFRQTGVIAHLKNKMNSDFNNVMKDKTDYELFKIITTHREDYQPDAVRAA
jgi:hypothetical protein